MSFLFEIDDRSAEAAEFITHVRHELLEALAQEKKKHKAKGKKLTQQALAEKLGIHRSVINRILAGEANLTLRTVSDIAWALNRDISFQLKEKPEVSSSNVSPDVRTDPITNVVHASPVTFQPNAGRVAVSTKPATFTKPRVTTTGIHEEAF